MTAGIVQSRLPVTLLGAGEIAVSDLDEMLAIAPTLVAADGGANVAVGAGVVPDHVIGDLDSLSEAARVLIPAGRLARVEDQSTTDFEKCLERIAAPAILAIGFTGGRLDHELAVWNVLARRRAYNCIVVGREDVVVLAPQHLRLELAPGTRVSLFPMSRVRAESEGLRWPVKGLDFAPDGVLGISNEATGPVELSVHEGRMLLILPRACLRELLRTL